MLGLQQQGCLGGLRGHVLDVLALVENHVVEFLLSEILYVVAHQSVGGENHLVLHRLLDVAIVGIIGVN